MKRFHTRKVLLPAACLIAGAAIAVSSTAAVASSSPTASPYGVNSNGETFGSATSAHSVADEPDLIQAEATNGAVGYVKKSDLEPQLKSPSDAIALTKKTQAGYTIPVYSADGKNVVGVFQVGGPAMKVLEQPAAK